MYLFFGLRLEQRVELIHHVLHNKVSILECDFENEHTFILDEGKNRGISLRASGEMSFLLRTPKRTSFSSGVSGSSSESKMTFARFLPKRFLSARRASFSSSSSSLSTMKSLISSSPSSSDSAIVRQREAGFLL